MGEGEQRSRAAVALRDEQTWATQGTEERAQGWRRGCRRVDGSRGDAMT